MDMLRCLGLLLGTLIAVSSATGQSQAGVFHDVRKVNGVKVDFYRWIDSQGLRRSVALKREGGGNPGHGGYAVRMTYQVATKAGTRTVKVKAPGGDGFGYFVSHERYRDFTDGDNGTIARKIFGKDDSPLGRKFAVSGKKLSTGDPDRAAHRFKMNYPRYGTKRRIEKKKNGSDVKPTPVNPAKLGKYTLPVAITWHFQTGTDFPRIQVVVRFGDVPGPDRVNFDLRGPYGVMRFDDGKNANVRKVVWGDRYHFKTLDAPVTRDSAWTWKKPNKGARYHALIAGGYEMGLFEPKRFGKSSLVDGYSDERGSTSALFNNGNGCQYQDQLLPCDWEWPYQSLQYSLPYDDNNTPTNYKKMAWGSTAYYGTGKSLERVWESPTTSRKFTGWPSGKAIRYSVCVVLGRTVPGSLTRKAAAGPAYSCASTS